jgi:ABC-type uncharacterized transport system permease subunit
LGLAILAPFTGEGRLLLGLVIGLYLLVCLAASIATAYKSNWRYLPLLPFVFATLHLSYGLGFLIGLVKFWNRWGDSGARVLSSYNTRGQGNIIWTNHFQPNRVKK